MQILMAGKARGFRLVREVLCILHGRGADRKEEFGIHGMSMCGSLLDAV